ncbi:hypothetical protein [Shimia sp. R9_3]|uniref:hypothetical protein n=1 Tax=Shimia sp. R9_3 TaxID=2821113 RepID=UPI001ADD5E34|nr:hypothetical protein [Shimia sp. R9_3]MBO9402292.1 hypothetical protein [Shimia sp. R9_3]
MPRAKTAPRRATIPHAQTRWQSPRHMLRWLLRHLADARQFYPPLSDHLARDIGLTATDLEPRRTQLPSRHTHHPYG